MIHPDDQWPDEVTVTITRREANLMFDELTYAIVEPNVHLNRYEKDMSKMAVKVMAQLTDQHVTGEMACSQ